MRVLILGEGAPGAILHSYRDGFEAAGCEVDTLTFEEVNGAALPEPVLRSGRRLAPSLVARRFGQVLLRRVREARHKWDLVFVIKGIELNAATIDAIRRFAGSPVVNFYPDDPFTSVYGNYPLAGAQTLAAYDVCFTFAKHLIPTYHSVGARHTAYLPFARDPRLHAPPENPLPPEFDVVFLGNLDAERVATLEHISEFRIGIFGERTLSAVPSGSPLRSAELCGPVVGAELARSLARGAISVNIMRPHNRLNHNMRSFESPACGAFTLSQRTPELAELFAEGQEIAFFIDPADLRKQVRYWLDHSERRAQIARAGFERVRDQTYERRASQILEAAGLR